MKRIISFSAVSGCGKVRRENQDRIYADGNILSSNGDLTESSGTDEKNDAHFAVFDGMGGEQYGEKAAQIALDCFSSRCKSGESTASICTEINDEICLYMKKNGINSMGTTAAIIRFSKDRAEICNIGDSRIYRISNGIIKQISVDHVMTVGRIKQRRVLTQHLGIPQSEMLIEPYIETVEIHSDDIFLICSDGLTDMLTEEEIFSITDTNEINGAALGLYNEAMNRGGHDNTSVIALKVKEIF